MISKKYYTANWSAKTPGEIPSIFLKDLKKVLRVENPDSNPIASSVISLALPSLMSTFAWFTLHSFLYSLKCCFFSSLK